MRLDFLIQVFWAWMAKKNIFKKSHASFPSLNALKRITRASTDACL
jgi:hypothetical protein